MEVTYLRLDHVQPETDISDEYVSQQIIYRSPKTLQELKTGLLSDTYEGHICYLFDNEREEPVDAYALNLSRADTVTIYLVKTDEPTGDST